MVAYENDNVRVCSPPLESNAMKLQELVTVGAGEGADPPPGPSVRRVVDVEDVQDAGRLLLMKPMVGIHPPTLKQWL